MTRVTKMISENGYPVLVIVAPFLAVLAIFILVAFVQYIDTIRHELRLINLEIGRTSGKEKRYWKRRRRRLIWSILPFVKY